MCFTLHGFHLKKERAVLKLIIQFKPIHMYSLLGVGKPSITILAGRLIQKQQQYLSDVVNGAFYDFCYVFLCAWMQVGSNLTYVPFLYVK